MTKDEKRAAQQYKNNPLARIFVDTLCAQIGIPATTGSALMILAHADLLSMLELGAEAVNAEIQRKIMNAPPKGEIWLRP